MFIAVRGRRSTFRCAAPGLWGDSSLHREQDYLVREELAAGLAESATGPAEALAAGEELTVLRQQFRHYVSDASPAGALRRAAIALCDSAWATWAAKSREPEARLAILQLLDPAATMQSVRLSAVGVQLTDWKGPLVQLSVAFGLVCGNTAQSWNMSHQVLLLTDRAAFTLASGGAGPVRIDPTRVSVVLVPSASVAEAAAVLWDPQEPGSAYYFLGDAVEAAKALTGDLSVASSAIAAWSARCMSPAGR